MTVEEAADRLVTMDPHRPGVARLGQEIVAELLGLTVKPSPVQQVWFHMGPRYWHHHTLAKRAC